MRKEKKGEEFGDRKE